MWFKVDDQLAFNAKVVAAGNEAMGLWVRAGSWSAAQLTNGFIPEHMANAMANGMANECGAISLCHAGLWDEVEGGYQFHDWDDFQPCAEDEKERRREISEKRKAAGRKGAAARWAGNSDGKPDGKRNGKPMANALPDYGKPMAPSRPDPSLSISNDIESGGAPTKPKPANRKTRIPDDWAPNESHEAKAAELGVDLHAEAEKFQDHAIANGKTFVDWSRGFHTWLNNALKFGPRPGGRPSERGTARNRADERTEQSRAVIENLHRYEQQQATTIRGELL